MPLDDETLPEWTVGLRRRREQLIEKALLRFSKADDRCILEGVEIEGVAVERQQGELAGCRVKLLAISFHHDDAGPVRRIDESATFGHNRDLFLRVPAIIDQESGHLSPIASASDIDRDLVRDRREGAFLD